MEWTDEGIVLGVRRHGEANAILELMTREHGRHLGLVRGGAGSRLRPVLQPGNTSVRCGGRGSTSISAITRSKGCACARPDSCRFLRALRAHASVRPGAAAAGARSASRAACRARADPRPLRQSRARRRSRSPASSCGCSPSSVSASTSRNARRPGRGTISSMFRRSRARGVARSRRALAGQAAAPAGISRERIACERRVPDDLADGFALTGFFLDRHVFEPRGLALPDARGNFVAAVSRAMAAPATLA